MQNYSFWPGPVWPNCSSTFPQFPFVDVFTKKIFFFKGKADLANAVAHDCGTGCLYNVEADPGEHTDLSKRPEYASLLTSLQRELSDLNTLNPREPDYGLEPAVEACLQAVKTGTYGPFVDADSFYTEWAISERSSQSLQVDFNEISTLHVMLSNATSRREMVKSIMSKINVDSEVVCLET